MADTIDQDYVGRIREGTGEFAGEWLVSFGDNDNSWSFGSREEAIHFAAVLKGVTAKHVARARREGAEAMREMTAQVCHDRAASLDEGVTDDEAETDEEGYGRFQEALALETSIRALPLPTTEENDG